MLYILNKRTGVDGIKLALWDKDAKVVLIEDGCYLNVTALKGKATIYAIEEDVKIRGLINKRSSIELIDYERLVDLIEENKVVNFG